jgi:hypothetical protein
METTVGWKLQLDGNYSWMETTVGWKLQLDGNNSWMETTDSIHKAFKIVYCFIHEN